MVHNIFLPLVSSFFFFGPGWTDTLSLAAEDFHTNDYPDEPGVFGGDEEDECGRDDGRDQEGSSDDEGNGGGDDDDDDDDDDDEGGSWKLRRMRSRTMPGEEEYDLNDDGDDEKEGEEQKMRRMARDIWNIK